jgi:hypothetical protein
MSPPHIPPSAASARAINLMIGRAAFETAKRMFPKDCIEYRHGAQIIERSGDTCV